MNNTTTLDHDTYKHGSLAAWRLLSRSDGTRGRDGGLKQYIVRVEMTHDGKFVVTKFWGKADGQPLHELASKRVGVYGNFLSARTCASMVAAEKTNGKYWSDYYHSVELVEA